MWGIEVDYRYTVIILLIVPIFIYGALFLKSELLFWFIILTLAFCEGTFDLMGFSASLNRLGRDFLIILYFIFNILIYKTRFKWPFFKTIFILIGVCTISMYLNNTSVIQLLLFFRRLIISVLLFWLAFNSKFDIYRDKKFFTYLTMLFIVQIFFSVYKLFLIGINENYIGSISVRSGSLTTIYTLIGSAVVFALYLYKKKKRYLLLIFGFIFFGIVGSKRAIVIYVPLLLFFVFYIYTKISLNTFTTNFLKKLFGISFLSLIFIYIIVIANTSLNPENKIGGSFNLNFLKNYFNTYNNDDRMGIGRLRAPELVFQLLGKNGTRNLIWGLGPGDLISSSLTSQSGVGGDEALLLEKYTIWYGGRTGLLWTVMQIGLIGLFFYMLFFFKVFYRIYKLLNKSNNLILRISVVSFMIIFFFDFFTYSATFTLSNIFTYILFISMGLAINDRNNVVSKQHNPKMILYTK